MSAPAPAPAAAGASRAYLRTQGRLLMAPAIVMLLVAMVLLINMLVEVSYTLIDPRLARGDLDVEEP